MANPRFLVIKIEKYLKMYPVVILTGARQTGKSTLLENSFAKNWKYYNLDERALVSMIQSDPDQFIASQKSNFILDEAHKAPEIFHSIKYAVDSGFKYKIILSGSANFLLLKGVTESLAGRAGVLELYPYSYSEKYKLKNPDFLEKIQDSNNLKKILPSLEKKAKRMNLSQDVVYGNYPKIQELKKGEDKRIWFENYRVTYLEKDLRDIASIAYLNEFQRFYEMAAYLSGGILNYASMARDLGISVQTSMRYLSILITSYQNYLIPPYYANIGKRLIKSPKLYSMDTGLACYFMKYRDKDDLLLGGKWGNLLENWIVSELIKQNSFLKEKFTLYYYRTSNGVEIDLILEFGQKLIPIEIKSSSKVENSTIQSMKSFMESISKLKRVPFGIILYGGDKILEMDKNIYLIPISCIL
jgi:hypothetical protein